MYKNVGEFACTLCALNIALFFIEMMELFNLEVCKILHERIVVHVDVIQSYDILTTL